MCANKYVMYFLPKFSVIGKTLTVRLDDHWCSSRTSNLQDFPSEGKQQVYHSVDRIVVMCNLFEYCVIRTEFFEAFQSALYAQNPELEPVPMHFITHNCVSLTKEQKQHYSIVQIDSFELTTQLIYDLSEHKHCNTEWHPHTGRILFLPGKLRPARYETLKTLLTHFPDRLDYTLSRYLTCNVERMNTPEQQLEWWLRDITSMHSTVKGTDCEAVCEFAQRWETDTWDTDSVQMNDHSQLLSREQLETSSISVISETVPWMTEWFTEKTYGCIAHARPFVHYHHINDYLLNRGYRVFWDSRFADCTLVDYLDQFVTDPDVHTVQEILAHNQQTMKQRASENELCVRSVFPEFGLLSQQEKIDILITYNPVRTVSGV